MKIKFTGYSVTEREVELTQEELNLVFELMKQIFTSHIEFGTFDREYYSTPEQKAVMKFCNKHQLDGSYKKDRVAFFQAIMNSMENPFK
jgi:polyphosphate kinase 2 (PPK2 family)